VVERGKDICGAHVGASGRRDKGRREERERNGRRRRKGGGGGRGRGETEKKRRRVGMREDVWKGGVVRGWGGDGEGGGKNE